MTPLFVDRIVRPEPHGTGYEQFEQRYREAMRDGREVRVAAGRRAEYDVPAGSGAVVYVVEGAVRFEGDDTQAGPGDIVWFRAADRDGAVLGIEADAAFRGFLVTGPAAPH